MSRKDDQAEGLLDELENLKKLLNQSNNVQDQGYTNQNLEMVEGIPMLNDQIPTLDASELVLDDNMDDPSSALSQEFIENIVDEIVASYLPVMEKELRNRLLSALSSRL
ncbi:hypothetical protein [Parendozoicomonas haliclonae]|uniref:Uncharacterized protein n=1 Tax=Parendozoicomonas haliclonae TaxID=1960125 RepID=A0A1X7ADT1_9GAMM|nr:hypothetical protein [Parendozoicomonas haliclonae]SMA32640.1 hypothetical protein EHSB41UT_00172 [Parendozoicomonas haliclonae]